MTDISGLIISLNEEKNIEACIKSLLTVCTEVIVIDSFSEDNTVEVAKTAGAQVIQQKFLGDGPQRNFGLQFCRNGWVLNLDADERLDRDAIEEIGRIALENMSHEAFAFKRKNFLHGKWIRVAGWYPDYVIRLFNKACTDFSPVFTHSKIVAKKPQYLQSHIIHYSFQDYTDMLEVLNRYTSWQARSMVDEGRRLNCTTPFTHAFFSFFKHFILKKGFLGGTDGFIISYLAATGSFFKYAKALELISKEKAERK